MTRSTRSRKAAARKPAKARSAAPARTSSPAKARKGYVAREPSPVAREKAARVYAILKQTYPEATCALQHEDPWQLLVSTILSAQCTDARVNLVTPALFSAFPTPESTARAPVEAIENLVRSTGFFRNKAKNIKASAERVGAAYGGQVPRAMEELLTLPGVARKTANVVRGVAYGLADGVVVDTHVHRLSRRLGWTKQNDPEKIERDLMALFPKADWIDLGHVLIWHGRRLCAARKPLCAECPVNRLCPSSLA